MQTGSLNLMKKINQQLILKTINNNNSISRAQIAEKLNLSPSTVTSNTNKLLDAGLIKETKKGKSRGGRKPILLELNNKDFYVCGIEWGVHEIKSVLLNLNRKIISSNVIKTDSYDLKSFIKKTKTIISSYQKEIKKNGEIFGIGLGCHGIVNADKGKILFAPYFKWENIELKKILEDKIQYNFLIDNDVRMMAYSEKWNENEDFVYIYSGYGLGSAIVLDNKVHNGSSWSAGEFGHMTIIENGPKCVCGSYGCLNALISVPELVKNYNNNFTLDHPYSKIQTEWNNIIQKALAGSKKERKILKKVGNYLGLGISNILNFINPNLIIIGGEFTKAQDILFPIIKEKIKNNTLKTCNHNIKIKPTSFENLAGPIGAATKVLHQIFEVNIND